MKAPKITTLDQLVYNLNLGPGYDGYKTLVDAIELNPLELLELCDWMSKDHMRISIYDTPCLEAIVTYWRPGNETPIHNYSFQQGWVKVLQGTLELEHFQVDDGSSKAELTDTEIIESGEFIYLNDSFGFHRFRNIGENEVIAIHLYADKITQWTILSESDGSLKEVSTRYDKTLA
jgi:hypothetical protein